MKMINVYLAHIRGNYGKVTGIWVEETYALYPDERESDGCGEF